MFRIFERHDLEKWHRLVSEYFTALHGEFDLFGYDWLGRCFAIDREEGENSGLVVLLEVGTLDIYYIEKDIISFLNDEIPNNSDACLDAGRYQEWLEVQPPVRIRECAGYRIPLFLGGEDSLENMEISDMEVYWDMTSQLWEAVKDLPEGTKIGNVTFE
ncbi:T6SS immunity protein Tdi1 domain-containing protein [Adlercreutzia sp. R7]|uniref:T6SS immunity protein Tdi1 domain-containing protein n=1 Tax=Adlercreutzia wanghongyangiae TaxID=3111451 RepID=A0ABU6IFS6_9ACTN|nr:T6SS immunity protein Tdi1 domain-containing protein [Adlercreutzia sp. R7]